MTPLAQRIIHAYDSRDREALQRAVEEMQAIQTRFDLASRALRALPVPELAYLVPVTLPAQSSAP